MKMGASIFNKNSYSNFDGNKDPNPKPDNYQILQTSGVGDYTIIKLKYLDCTNYEGVKILVFKASLSNIINQKKIDPHFSDNKTYISPIARFEPTHAGLLMALALCELLNPKEAQK